MSVSMYVCTYMYVFYKIITKHAVKVQNMCVCIHS